MCGSCDHYYVSRASDVWRRGDIFFMLELHSSFDRNCLEYLGYANQLRLYRWLFGSYAVSICLLQSKAHTSLTYRILASGSGIAMLREHHCCQKRYCKLFLTHSKSSSQNGQSVMIQPHMASLAPLIPEVSVAPCFAWSGILDELTGLLILALCEELMW